MKKLFIGFALVGVVVLSGCGYDNGHVSDDGRFKAVGDVGSYDVLRDTKTGCLYTEPHSDLGLSPLYDENGKVAGCGQKNIDQNKYN